LVDFFIDLGLVKEKGSQQRLLPFFVFEVSFWEKKKNAVGIS